MKKFIVVSYCADVVSTKIFYTKKEAIRFVKFNKVFDKHLNNCFDMPVHWFYKILEIEE